MFTNLRTALFQKGISMKQYAEFLGVGEKTVQNKMKGMTDFTYPEFKKLAVCFCQSTTLIICLQNVSQKTAQRST